MRVKGMENMLQMVNKQIIGNNSLIIENSTDILNC